MSDVTLTTDSTDASVLPAAEGAGGGEDGVADGDSLRWAVHPMMERKVAASFAIMVVAVFGLLVHQLAGGGIWSILAVCVLLLSLNSFFFPSRFELTPNGVIARFPFKTESYRWADIQNWVADAHIVLLRFVGNRRRRRPLQLLLGRHGPEVVAYLQKHLPGKLR